jgi:hypothetical protein
MKRKKMKTFKFEIVLDLDDDTTNVDWVFKAIEEQLEGNEAFVSGRFREEGYTTPKFEPAQEEEA